ncbi:3-dehydroquinate synthase [Paenibacillus sediminis]|uniref:3-dehydroquinate synthase n=1 Tax=Paenibacillus sediminis TaxID=664909 RepID=A0ABS4GZX7_9BACL|nr:3-dehydroquinate synthase [Paenibacillus sediminis]MBP1935766.1 3-dehydroquinate synthase [Paenibacillus sediminis]
MRTLTVELGERSYPIYIGQGLLQNIASFFEKHQITKKSPLFIITDTHVAPHYLNDVETNLHKAGYTVISAVVESGEQSKSLAVYEQMMTKAIEAGLDRSSTVIALGGGVVGDLAGFVAATYMRGVRFVQIPTTILAHDSSVGGKVAVNHPLAKNMIGVFHQPVMVLYDTSTLQTLPIREVRAGLAEMVKHGLIWDEAFARWCDQHAEDLLALDPETLAYGLEKGCSIKAQIVSRDERENDLRAILNLGHTLGHAIEATAGYGEFLHGEAISIGMAGAALLAVQLGADPSLYTETKRILERFGLPTVMPKHLDTDQVMNAMMHDKKFKEGNMVYIVPKAIGQVYIDTNMKVSAVRNMVERLKEGDIHV